MDRNLHRKSNFELLRIIAMLMIMGSHFACHSGFLFPNSSITVNRLWIQFLTIGGKLGVDIFVLISGYFLINVQKIHFEKVIRILFQIVFYSVVIYWFCVVFGIEKLNVLEALKVFFPITTSQWWFATTYFILYLFVPYINRLLRSLDEKDFQVLLLMLFFIWCILPTVFRCEIEVNNLVWFLCLYSVAGYIRLWRDNVYVKPQKAALAVVIFLLINFGTTVVFDVLGMKWPVFSQHARPFQGQNQFPTFAAALGMFLLFKNTKIQFSKMINQISSTTFGVYLIHDNFYLRLSLWNFLQGEKYSNSPYLFLYSLGVVCVLFMICVIIEFIRIKTIERFFMNCIYQRIIKIEFQCRNIIRKTTDFLFK